jgi:hypothetical protein
MKRLAIAVVACACSGRASPPVGSRLGPALAAAMAAADQAREPWRCAAPDGPGVAAEALTVGSRTWRLDDHALRLDERSESGTAAPTGELAIGVIADAASSAPATLAALGRLRGQLERVDLVISLGGMGATRAELEATLTAVASHARWPLVALPGDLEPIDAHAEAIAAARQAGAPVIDGRLIQRIELPAATIALVPGAGAASRLVAGAGGCSYRAADVATALAELTQRAGLRILASAEPPRSGTRDEPSGERELTAGAGQELDIALHGPTTGAASPARSGRRDGAAVALTPGSSDAAPRLPGFYRPPSAGILTLRGDAWSWRPIDAAGEARPAAPPRAAPPIEGVK